MTVRGGRGEVCRSHSIQLPTQELVAKRMEVLLAKSTTGAVSEEAKARVRACVLVWVYVYVSLYLLVRVGECEWRVCGVSFLSCTPFSPRSSSIYSYPPTHPPPTVML